MNTAVITDLCKQLDKARTRLHAAVEQRKALDLGGHQKTLTVCIGDSRVTVTECDRDTGYMSKCIRGREMILLGMQKVINAEVDYWKAKCASLRQQIAEVAGGAA